MGDAFDRLPAELQAIHDVRRAAVAEGAATVDGPANPIARLIGRIVGFPPSGRHILRVAFVVERDVETWTRDFGGHAFRSELRHKGRHLVERFGPLRFRFDLPADDRGLAMVLGGWSAFGIPLPTVLAPRTVAREWSEDGRFHFDVSITLPLIGRIVRYRGWLGAPTNRDGGN